MEKKNIVCFGGGTGLPSLLSGLKKNSFLAITAVVNMFDSGGSSGALKDRFGILPPGDVLKCLLALAEDEQTARRILLKRIPHPPSPGHTGGNLLLLALGQVYKQYSDAIDALGQILSVQGSVAPVTYQHATLCARFADGSVARDETSVDAIIAEGKEIASLFLDPDVEVSDRARQAVASADAICIGPGSFYTSVLPNFLPIGVRDAIARSSARVIFIGNLLLEGSGMRGMTLTRLVERTEQAIGRRVDAVVANDRAPDATALETYVRERKQPLLPNDEEREDPRMLFGDFWKDHAIARHDSSRIAAAVFAALSSLYV